MKFINYIHIWLCVQSNFQHAHFVQSWRYSKMFCLAEFENSQFKQGLKLHRLNFSNMKTDHDWLFLVHGRLDILQNPYFGMQDVVWQQSRVINCTPFLVFNLHVVFNTWIQCKLLCSNIVGSCLPWTDSSVVLLSMLEYTFTGGCHMMSTAFCNIWFVWSYTCNLVHIPEHHRFYFI